MPSDVDHLVDRSIAEWKVPGLALAVIQDDEVVLLKGYGVRDIDSRLPVTVSTQFLLCSITKSFTAAGLGILVDEGKLEWRRPVREYIPEFRLYDAVATERVTVRDLLCHHSGLPRHDWIHAPGDLSTAQVLATLRHLEPSRDLRDVYQYQNLGYLVAGHVAERITGMSWDAFITERLLRPLGLTDMSLSIEALRDAPDHAHPHVADNDEVRRASWAPIRNLPAGGLNASVSDLAKWMRFLMNDGIVDGESLLSANVVRQMSAPHVHVGRSVFSEVGDFHYGFGLQVGHYRGERVLSHSGSWLGWGTLMTMLPERRLGVAVLTNYVPTAVGELLTYSAFDELCAHQPIDWFERFRSRRRQLLAQQKIDDAARKELRRADTAPTHALDDYAGDYEHPAYGRISIATQSGTLAWRWRGLSGQLEHRHYDVFATPHKVGELYPDGLLLTFGYNREGVIDQIAAALEPMVEDIVFRRIASGDALDPAFLARCAGAYAHGAQQMTVTLAAAGHLTLHIVGQPRRRLTPCGERTFDIGELKGYRVEFHRLSSNVVDAMIFHQPNGTFLALRDTEKPDEPES
ncbi:serine hydrolase [Paraburkholderia humisilvae]|uniref:D-aminopeptidase n=1 Tax=Paraburkholderia humisilvae TaxID=627669 RepID=A0A6J5CZ52_9BURK|nr:serine hydrolase [Paraburkholderia humisilvae]CAB3746232.1 D-aminopeptidase [Paraburkholderia humisilvae]